MLENLYTVSDSEEIITPNLVYYKDIIIENTKKAINIAGDADRLWPHVKSHKMSEMIKLQKEMGIKKFKCATIAEAEMLVNCHAGDIVLAYPLIGPNIKRFIDLEKSTKKSRLWAIGDNYEQLKLLSEQSVLEGAKIRVLLDVNLGMDRTGIPIEKAEDLYRKCYELDGIELDGLHCYDGNQNNKDINIRKKEVADSIQIIKLIVQSLQDDGLSCSVIIAGGTPSFPCYAKYKGIYLSPGTLFLSDYGYLNNLPDLKFIPAAALITRVISHPNDNLFTIDLGYKGIAADPAGLVGFENEASHFFQSEEHWVFRMEKGYEKDLPKIGDVLYVIPTHICPTSALYPKALVSQNGKIIDVWQVTARNRKITI